jgi:ABC-2 type transport system permease protein
MPIGIRWFAQYQPFTPVIDTLWGLRLVTPMGNSAILAVAWCVVLALVGYLWKRPVYNRNSPALGRRNAPQPLL